MNAFGAQEYGQPLFLASSADLAGSTNISGFGAGFGSFDGYGWYERHGSAEGALLPQEITGFANAGIMAGLATVNLSEDPESEFRGLWGTTSTYGSFSYLLYGMVRLFGPPVQDCEWKLGKVLWVVRPFRSGDRSRQPHPLRDLRSPGHPVVSPGADHQPASVGVQRGAGCSWQRR